MPVADALVLNHVNYRDYDRMVTLLSPTLGRVDAVARGCRKPKSPLMNATERFSAGEFSLVEAGGRYTLSSCRITESFYPLREDFDRLTAGAYLLHLLLLAAQPGQPCQELFLTALQALAYLAYGQLPIPMVVKGFELHYLALTGQAPRVDSCLRCSRPFAQEASVLDVAGGGAVCAACARVGRPLSHGARRILLRVPQTRFQSLEKLPGHPDWPEAARHTRRFIQYRLDRPPRLWPELPQGGESPSRDDGNA